MDHWKKEFRSLRKVVGIKIIKALYNDALINEMTDRFPAFYAICAMPSSVGTKMSVNEGISRYLRIDKLYTQLSLIEGVIQYA